MTKNFLFTFCLFLLMAPLWAQKATEKDLQGNWKLITYAVSGASLDVETGKVTLNEGDGSPLMAAMGIKLKTDMEAYAEGLRVSSLEITGNNFYQVIVDFARNGSFTITEKNDQQFISAKFDDGSGDDIPFKIIDGKLYLLSSQSPKQYVYSKL
jgi:hypothetical protein